jgi:hypothetical protein
LAQVPIGFWVALTVAIGAAEQKRATIGWVEPENVPVGKTGLLRDDYLPGNLGFDPLGLKPSDPTEFFEMQTKELQNGRLGAMRLLLPPLVSWRKSLPTERESWSIFGLKFHTNAYTHTFVLL